MIDYFFAGLLAFAGALFVKIADDLTDERIKSPRSAKYVLGILYGAVLGVLLSLSTETMTWGLAIIAGVLLHERIDRAHQWGLAAMLAVLFLIGVPEVNFLLFAGFAFFAVLDEMLNERHDAIVRAGAGKGGLKMILLRERPMLPAACLTVSVATGNYIYIAIMAAFQIGYWAAGILSATLPRYSTAFARQLIFDCYRCGSAELGKKEFIAQALNELPALIGMRKISKVCALYHEAENPEDAGVTGFVIIAESHIAIHTYPEKRLVKVDVVSCREFDVEAVEKYLTGIFKPAEMRKTTLPRGI